MEKFDVVVIGAGAVGCSTAIEIAKREPKLRVGIIEKNNYCGIEASGRSSGVLHSGFHHIHGSLKERLANSGSKLAKEYSRVKNIPLLEYGMLIIIPKIVSFADVFKDINLIKIMYQNSRTQNINFQMLGPRGVRKLEPNVRAAAGIFLPDIAVIDLSKFLDSLYQDTLSNGVKFFFNTQADNIEVGYDEFFINNSRISTKSIINCTCANADKIARMVGLKYKQYLARGEYYQVVGRKSKIVSRLIYPAVTPGHSTKGVHFLPWPDGRLLIGPNSKLVSDSSDYMNNLTPPEEFINAVNDFVPGLKVDDLKWCRSGIRPKLSIDGDEDFIIKIDIDKPRMVTNMGIGSPGLSASMAIAKMNYDLLMS